MTPEQELIALRQVGDLMQSACARLHDFIDKTDERPPSEYSLMAGLAEARDAVEAWTDIRCQSGTSTRGGGSDVG